MASSVGVLKHESNFHDSDVEPVVFGIRTTKTNYLSTTIVN
jgi:hypothetical protein